MIKPEDIVLLARLLRQREAAFVAVRDCEDRICRRLGGAAFPFPPPPVLPSTRRTERSPAMPARGAALAALRRLRPGEDAYRIRGLWRGAPCESLSDDLDAVRALAALPPELLTLQQIEAVTLDEAGTVVAAESLWQAAPEPAGAAPAGQL